MTTAILIIQYYGNFIEQGYDDLNQIIEICKNVEEIESFLKGVGLVTKPGHKRRSIAAIKIEISKADQGLECSKESARNQVLKRSSILLTHLNVAMYILT